MPLHAARCSPLLWMSETICGARLMVDMDCRGLIAHADGKSVRGRAGNGQVKYCRACGATLARPAQGELEQGRRLMRRVASENRRLHTIVRRGRAAVGELEAALPGGAPPSAAVAAAAGALSSLARPRACASRLSGAGVGSLGPCGSCRGRLPSLGRAQAPSPRLQTPMLMRARSKSPTGAARVAHHAPMRRARVLGL